MKPHDHRTLLHDPGHFSNHRIHVRMKRTTNEYSLGSEADDSSYDDDMLDEDFDMPD